MRIWVAAGAFFSLEIPPEGGATYFLNLDQLEPANPNVVIWRFMHMDKFRDLIATSKLYFCADKFNDELEGSRLKNTCLLSLI